MVGTADPGFSVLVLPELLVHEEKEKTHPEPRREVSLFRRGKFFGRMP